MQDFVTPEMLRAAQLNTELGSYACCKLAGGYELITELYNVMREAEANGENKIEISY